MRRLVVTYEPPGGSCSLQELPFLHALRILSLAKNSDLVPWLNPLACESRPNAFVQLSPTIFLKITTLFRLSAKPSKFPNLNTVSFELTIHNMKFEDNSTWNRTQMNNPGFPRSKSPQNPKIIQIKPKWLMPPGRYSSLPGNSSKNSENWVAGLCRLTVQGFTARRFLEGTQKH